MRSTKTREELAENLIVFAGMPRTGSTSLFHILGQHPAIFRPFRKEMGYFLFNHHKGEHWYLRAYAEAAPRQRCIDITPEYFFDPSAVEKISTFGPGVRVVIGVRDPATFAVSLHREYGKRYTVPPLETFVESYSYSRGSASIHFSLRSGDIRKMLRLYHATFGGRLFLYDFAAFSADPLSVLQQLETFMDIEPFFTEQTFRNVVMNTAGRSTHRWLSALLSAEPWIDSATRILPAALLRRLAAVVYSGSGKAKELKLPPPPEWMIAMLQEDRRFIEELFRGSAVISGDERSMGEEFVKPRPEQSPGSPARK